MNARKTILTHYEEALLTLKTSRVLRSVKINKLDTRDLLDTKLPAAWVFSGKEVRGDFKYGAEWWDWDIIIQVWAENEDMEELLEAVNAAIYKRYVDEEFVEILYRKSAELYVTDSDGQQQGWVLVYHNTYETAKGTT